MQKNVRVRLIRSTCSHSCAVISVSSCYERKPEQSLTFAVIAAALICHHRLTK
ncbi:hypothetical protein GCM10029978_063940 [Actinoallomurus acanthiterrae]